LAGTVSLSKEGAVAVLTLENAPARNAFGQEMADALVAKVEEVAADPSVRALLLRGRGDHFCAGGDLAAISGASDPPAYTLRLARTANRALEAFRTMPKPVLAELKGAVAGGGVGVALAADLRIASDTTKLLLAFLKVGLSPDMGATWALPRLVGRGRAFEIAAAKDPMPAEEALRLGLVNRVVKGADLEREALAWAHELAALPPRAVAETKALLNGAEGNRLTEHLALDSAAIARTTGTEDFREGVRAFFEKRPPRFEGR
jgi:2-(1,2-epoxy-1,2-dihydrophenyl)acetyl-CoA isomerase